MFLVASVLWGVEGSLGDLKPALDLPTHPKGLYNCVLDKCSQDEFLPNTRLPPPCLNPRHVICCGKKRPAGDNKRTFTLKSPCLSSAHCGSSTGPHKVAHLHVRLHTGGHLWETVQRHGNKASQTGAEAQGWCYSFEMGVAAMKQTCWLYTDLGFHSIVCLFRTSSGMSTNVLNIDLVLWWLNCGPNSMDPLF